MKTNNSISKQNYNKQVALTKYVRNIKYKQNSIEIKLLQRKRKINNEQNKVTSSINNMNNVNNKSSIISNNTLYNIHYNEEKFILKGEEFNHDKLNYFLNKRINTKIDTARSQTKNIINNVLPIFDYKDTILQKLSENRIIIICGNTGCGKSTQIIEPNHFLKSFFLLVKDIF